MNSPKPSAPPSNFKLVDQIVSLLWPIPLQVRTTGQPGKSLIILPNARSSLGDLLPDFNQYTGQLRLLVLDSGGMDAACASAFRTASKEEALKRVKSEKPEVDNANLFLPVSLARRWELEDGDEFGAYQVCTIPDVIDHWNMGSFPRATSIPNVLWTRLKHAPAFWLGQALIIALPLAIFGWYAVLVGLGMLLFASFLLALVWDVLPMPGMVISLIAGLLLAALAAFGLPALSLLSNTAALRMSVACFVAFVWMGFVFQGLKKG